MKTLKLKQSLLIVLLVLPFATIAACQAPAAPVTQEATVITGVVKTSENNPTGTVTTGTTLPQSITLYLSQAPKVGETADLTVRIRNYDTRTTKRVTKTRLEFMWRNTEGTYHEYRNPVEVPMNEVLLGSTADWSGDLRADSPLEFKVPVKLLKPGLWDITAYADVEDATGKHEVYDRIFLGTTAEKAGIRGTDAERLGQLEWMKDYHDYTSYGLGRPGYLLETNVDFPNPPELGKPIELRWSVTSGYDTSPVRVIIGFSRQEPGKASAVTPPLNTVLLKGDLEWKGVVKKDSPVSGSATVVFPFEGDWEINIWCLETEGVYNAGTAVYLNVASAGGRWGWVEPHSGDLPHTVPAIPVK